MPLHGPVGAHHYWSVGDPVHLEALGKETDTGSLWPSPGSWSSSLKGGIKEIGLEKLPWPLQDGPQV